MDTDGGECCQITKVTLSLLNDMYRAHVRKSARNTEYKSCNEMGTH